MKIKKSAVAAHVWKENDAMDCKPVLIKQASHKQELTNWENILIIKNNDHIINFEILPADQLLQEIKIHNSRSWVDNEDDVFESAPHLFK